jgi:formate dehydrogenase major subunit
MSKPVPLATEITTITCPYCSVGCSIDVETHSNMIIKANPDKEGVVNEGLLCGKGKFGLSTSWLDGKIMEPQIANEDYDDEIFEEFNPFDPFEFEFTETSYGDAIMHTAKKAQSIAAKYGKDAVAVAISDRHTNEEAYALKKLADVMGAKALCFNNRASGLKPVLGIDASPNTIDELLGTELILAVGFNTVDYPIIKLKMKQAAENGAKVLLINPEEFKQPGFGFAEEYYTKNKNTFLKGIAKALIDMGKTSSIEGFDDFAKSLEKVKITDEMKAVAESYAKAKKAMIVFGQNLVTTETASLIANIALLSGHIGSPRDGILQIKAKNNSQGLIDMGITAGAEAMDGVKALLAFSEDIGEAVDNLEFLMASDTHLTSTTYCSDVLLPAAGFGCVDGTFTNTERRLQESVGIVEDIVLSSWQIASEIARVYEVDFGFEDTYDISMEMDDNVPNYKYAMIGEVLGGVLTPQNPKFAVISEGAFVDKLPCTDSLMNTTNMRLPKPQVKLDRCCGKQ